jgi:heme-degrading monooxygenase HmoA
MIASLSELQIAPADVDRYVQMRREHINPALAQQPGFLGSTLLRPLEQPDPAATAFTLFNFWKDQASAQAWAVAPRHDEVSRHVIPLVRSITTKRYERVEEASLTAGDEGRARVARISMQRVRPDRIGEYLDYRRTVIHPHMAAAHGFIAAWVLRDATDHARFAIYLRWTSADAADAHFRQPFHLGEITDRVKALIESPLATSRYEIVPVERP